MNKILLTLTLIATGSCMASATSAPDGVAASTDTLGRTEINRWNFHIYKAYKPIPRSYDECYSCHGAASSDLIYAMAHADIVEEAIREVPIAYRLAALNRPVEPAGATLLHLAVVDKLLFMVNIFLDAGADQTLKTNDDNTPRQLAEIMLIRPGTEESCKEIQEIINALDRKKITTSTLVTKELLRK